MCAPRLSAALTGLNHLHAEVPPTSALMAWRLRVQHHNRADANHELMVSYAVAVPIEGFQLLTALAREDAAFIGAVDVRAVLAWMSVASQPERLTAANSPAVAATDSQNAAQASPVQQLQLAAALLRFA